MDGKVGKDGVHGYMRHEMIVGRRCIEVEERGSMLEGMRECS